MDSSDHSPVLYSTVNVHFREEGGFVTENVNFIDMKVKIKCTYKGRQNSIQKAGVLQCFENRFVFFKSSTVESNTETDVLILPVS